MAVQEGHPFVCELRKQNSEAIWDLGSLLVARAPSVLASAPLSKPAAVCIAGRAEGTLHCGDRRLRQSFYAARHIRPWDEVSLFFVD